ncbi:aminomethyl-transferring glycine dehydrogenase subunit GcvPA [Natronobacterium gregoryi]|uniref:Aminomethyl-transferring glycine dehydrogenase n=2 Tax=Natronobacterium gregoryi TaxID=44930 RepID=L0AJM2_NATGS|nr:aminomethyl-transferring glycine dehydrogenase subunit GcvPA [Natronobacterium gregoryi]AFZ74011.1 glycine cleavage system protein P [Natronobacterium gregoryi SP2]ELY70583.1 glycine dehydrogenase subunit 1 [Natronobacterium gregoryi SP2]PLK20760.1 aminomethyl-transferring glycine dehydrogenase [Natronobacterium gregoryi SP2]SFJ07763.1 glycine dehydrogenase subunit 1 [Natronobacterium gregoryi]
MTGSHATGSPYAPHTDDDRTAMLEAVGAETVTELFDIPDGIAFDGEFGIDKRTERETRELVRSILDRNDELTELLGRGHYGYYVPSMVDHLADRSEFLTSYTQYQPEVSQGFLQVLFEYQSLLVELTGLEIANCSMYDAATALGEAATLSERVRSTSGTRVLVPDLLREGRKSTLENYVAGTDLVVDQYPTADGGVDLETLEEAVDDDVAMVYAENPTVRGTIEERLTEIGALADEADALFVLGSDPVALSMLQRPVDVGADVVIGDASVLGLPTSYGMGLGLFACREDYLRQVPGRLVGASEDDTSRRAYTLTLQTREQHIRRERATSNICTNQAWVALRTAMHAASLGPNGMVGLAKRGVRRAEELAARVDDLEGVTAPVHDRRHFREFVAEVDEPAATVAAALEERGFAVHVVDDHEIQLCTAGASDEEIDAFVEALSEVKR